MPEEPSRTQSCEVRIESSLQSRLDDLRRILAADENEEREGESPGSLSEYGLCFDYVAPGTFPDQEEAYFRYQLSWGGPSDEFRFFVNPNLSCHRIEYWFLDWFDGARRVLTDDAKRVLADVWEWFADHAAVLIERDAEERL